jgi:hypothetical protein
MDPNVKSYRVIHSVPQKKQGEGLSQPNRSADTKMSAARMRARNFGQSVMRH